MGSMEGLREGAPLAKIDGAAEGNSDGAAVGIDEGEDEGFTEGYVEELEVGGSDRVSEG